MNNIFERFAPRWRRVVARYALELIAKSGTDIKLSLLRGSNVLGVNIRPTNQYEVLGFACDMTGVQKAFDEGIVAVQGPYQLVANVSVKNGVTMVWVKIQNSADRPLQVAPDMFSAASQDRVLMNAMSISDVEHALYGDVHGRIMAEQAAASWGQVAATSMQTNANYQTTFSYGTALTRPDLATSLVSSIYTGYAMAAENRVREEFEKASADSESIARNTFVSCTIPPGFSNAGFVYFREPLSLPMTLIATIDGHKFAMYFEEKNEELTMAGLRKFCKALKPGEALRLRLRNGKEFVGTLARYDDERFYNEIYATPEGGSIFDKSFELKDIVELKVAHRNAVHLKPESSSRKDKPTEYKKEWR